MAIAKENDLVSSLCIVKILYPEFLRYALYLQNIFCIWMRKKKKKKKIESYYFFVRFHTYSTIT